MHPIEGPNDNFRLLIRQASALCVLVHNLYIAAFCGPESMLWPG